MRGFFPSTLLFVAAMAVAAAAPTQEESFAERLAAAKSVRVRTEILGIGIDSSLERTHATLDPLAAPSGRPAEATEGEEGGNKFFWKLERSDFSSVFIKADDKQRVTYILATFRPGKQIPFDQIGEVEKAPIQNEDVVAWDVARENRPLIRVVARGANRKAETITIFLVKRLPHR